MGAHSSPTNFLGVIFQTHALLTMLPTDMAELKKKKAGMKLTEGVAHTGTMGLILQEPIYLGVHYFGDT